jgi:hypothetical protein
MTVSSGIDIVHGTGGSYSLLRLCYYALATIYWLSTYLALADGQSLCGRAWLVTAPMVAVILLLSGVGSLLGNGLVSLDAPVSRSSKLVELLTGCADVVVALTLLTAWSVFWSRFLNHPQWGVRLTLLAEILFAGTALTAVSLAITTRGTDSGLLVITAVLAGIVVIIRGADRIKKLARRIQV